MQPSGPTSTAYIQLLDTKPLSIAYTPPSDTGAILSAYTQQSGIGPLSAAYTAPIFQNFSTASHPPMAIITTSIEYDKELSNLAKIYTNNAK